MECREAQELLSAAQDREALHDTTAASVAAHCRTCPDCTTFVAQLNALREAGAPRAPLGLAERISAAVSLEADRAELEQIEAAAIAAATAATGRDTPAAVDGSVVGRLGLDAPAKVPAWLTRGRLWFATTAVAVAALVMVGVVVVRTGEVQKASDLLAERAAGSAGLSTVAPPTASGGSVAQTPPAAAPSRIPDYVLWTGGVFSAAQSTDATASQLTPAGTMRSALNTGLVQALPVMTSSSDPRAIFLTLPGGAIERFDPVLRQRKGTSFQLQAGVEFQRYGVWPQLPPGPTPTSADGSPAFVQSGTDDAGVAIYVRVGDTPERGFAVAPGTAVAAPGAADAAFDAAAAVAAAVAAVGDATDAAAGAGTAGAGEAVATAAGFVAGAAVVAGAEAVPTVFTVDGAPTTGAFATTERSRLTQSGAGGP